MEIEILWWYWLALGLALIGIEALLPTFTILWFGIGAIFTGIVLLIAPQLSLAAQIGFFAAFSAIATVIWFQLVKPRMDRNSTLGMSKEAIRGETGTVLLGVASQYDKGRVRFAVPLLGTDEWSFLCNDPVKPGDHVRVADIEGHVLIVEKLG